MFGDLTVPDLPFRRMNALTFDIDWAPDCVLAELRDRLKQQNVQATFLVTHPSELLDDLRRDGHTLGIHPNFSPGSTQGNSPLQSVENLLKIVPDASIMRTHGLVQSSQLLIEISRAFPQIELDLSLFTYLSQRCEITSFYFSPDHSPLKRLNYNWEDDIAFNDPKFNPSKFTFWGNEHIFDFHPLHIFLNSSDGSEYSRLKVHLGHRSLTSATEQELKRFVNHGKGIGSYFELVLLSGMKFNLLLPEQTPALAL